MPSLLEEKISRRELVHPYAEEDFRYESVCLDVAKSLRYVSAEESQESRSECFRCAHFHHDPRILPRSLENHEIPPDNIPGGEYTVCITLRGDALRVELNDCS